MWYLLQFFITCSILDNIRGVVLKSPILHGILPCFLAIILQLAPETFLKCTKVQVAYWGKAKDKDKKKNKSKKWRGCNQFLNSQTLDSWLSVGTCAKSVRILTYQIIMIYHTLVLDTAWSGLMRDFDVVYGNIPKRVKQLETETNKRLDMIGLCVCTR